MRRDPIRAQVVPIDALQRGETHRMYRLMQKYYDGVEREAFLADLSDKDHAILLRNRVSGYIEGFSTLKTVLVQQDGKEIRGVFSGDTVLEKEFWGSRALGHAFLFYLWKKIWHRPWQPLYWLLITKGYKTYLLMANNFRDYYPNYHGKCLSATPELCDRFYRHLFPTRYNAELGVIENGEGAPRLRDQVAAPDQLLARHHPAVKHFVEQNPRWKQGVELACLAKMTIWMPLNFAIRGLLKGLRPRHRSVRSTTAQPVESRA